MRERRPPAALMEVPVVRRAPFLVADREGDHDGLADGGRRREGRRMAEGKDGVTRWLPDQRQSPLVAAGRREQADSDGEHGERSQDRPPSPRSGLVVTA